MSIIIADPTTATPAPAVGHDGIGPSAPLETWRIVAGCPTWCVLPEAGHGGYRDGRERHAGAEHDGEGIAAYLHLVEGATHTIQLTIAGSEYTVPVEVVNELIMATHGDRLALLRMTTDAILDQAAGAA